MRNKIWIVVSALAVLAIVNVSIALKEHHLATGKVVYLELAPVDPRSLMQGDYMALSFAIRNSIRGLDIPANYNGAVVVRVDERRIAHFVRLAKEDQTKDDQTRDDKALTANEMRLEFRVRNGNIKFATNAFFFQEGTGERYESARYGRFRVNADGELLLVSLHDETLKKLGEMQRGL